MEVLFQNFGSITTRTLAFICEEIKITSFTNYVMRSHISKGLNGSICPTVLKFYTLTEKNNSEIKSTPTIVEAQK